jgi:hypothetical protein
MSYNGSGTFNINTSGQPVVAGTVITASAFNALTADLATGLTTAITKDGQTATTAQIPFAAGLRSTLTTDSTTSTSGSIITDGGLGVAKAVNIGTTLGVAGAVTLSGGTANGVAYLNGSKVLTSGSALVFDGSNLGVGVTPAAWGGTGVKGFQISGTGALLGSNGSMEMRFNSYYDGSVSKYLTSTFATNYIQSGGTHQWYNAASGTAGNTISFTQAMTLDASGQLGIGETSPSSQLTIKKSASGALGPNIILNNSGGGFNDQTALTFQSSGASRGQILSNVDGGAGGSASMQFWTLSNSGASFTEKMRIDSSGNLIIASGAVQTTAGNVLVNTDSSTGTLTVNGTVTPRFDNASSVGSGSYRWSVIYAATGTINTSDVNLKQDIQELTNAERNVATAIKGLIKTFRFKDAVAEKGNAARIHVGVMAQAVKSAFEAEGLDANRYALFCSDTWIDEETNEEKTRLGIRYEELLAFVIAAL